MLSAMLYSLGAGLVGSDKKLKFVYKKDLARVQVELFLNRYLFSCAESFSEKKERCEYIRNLERQKRCLSNCIIQAKRQVFFEEMLDSCFGRGLEKVEGFLDKNGVDFFDEAVSSYKLLLPSEDIEVADISAYSLENSPYLFESEPKDLFMWVNDKRFLKEAADFADCYERVTGRSVYYDYY